MLTKRGAQSFVVITPSDIKVFEVSGEDSSGSAAVPAVGDDAAEVTDPETLAAIAAEEGRDLPGEPTLEEVTQPKAVRRKKNPSPAGHDEPCSRCDGKGRVAILLDGGGASETGCPICQGTGVMKKYGARR